MTYQAQALQAQDADGPAGRLGAAEASHQFLEHTGELHLRVRGRFLGEVLSEAGRALAALALRGSPAVPDGAWHEVTVRSSDREALLVDWLNELIYQAESTSEVPTDFEILEVDDRYVRARVRGVVVEQPPALVKAATLHGVTVQPVEGGIQADVVLDV
jgi:SHS2 domain-containing protein